MDIQTGSKWGRVKLYPKHQPVDNDYFLGQEVGVTNVSSIFVEFVTFSRGGRTRRIIVNKKSFELHFQPLNISLENK